MRAALALVVVALALGWAGGASASAWRGSYVVVSGDTLTLIAHRHGVSLERLAYVNRLDWHEPLQIGTVLRVPLPPARHSLPRWRGTYTVRLGDTLTGIAARHHVPLGELARENRLDPAAILLAGSKLHVPAPAPAPSITITVRAGDTLSGIAARYGVSLGALSALNGIDPGALLLVGRHLRIPVGARLPLSEPILALSEQAPYPSGAIGVDVSYPNCLSATAVGASGAFVVVGLNGGRPFTANPCFDGQYAAAAGAQLTPSVYLNSAYSPTLLRHVTPECRAASAAQPLARAEQQAYAVGCSEAAAAEPALASRPTAAIWIDVEPANTWSSKPAVNRATLQGLIDNLLTWTPRPVVGIYSRADYWREITGNWHSLALPEWIAAGTTPDLSGCGAPFASGTIWLSQHTTDHDQDTAC